VSCELVFLVVCDFVFLRLQPAAEQLVSLLLHQQNWQDKLASSRAEQIMPLDTKHAWSESVISVHIQPQYMAGIECTCNLLACAVPSVLLSLAGLLMSVCAWLSAG
jgi:hypothetical protein